MMDRKTKKRGYIIFSLIGILSMLFTLACNELSATENIIWNVSWIMKWIVLGIVMGILLGSLLFFVCLLWKEKGGVRKWGPDCFHRECNTGKTFGISLGCFVLCWFPAWLAYYPGICSYDIPAQMRQVLLGEYNTHHPLAHTLLVQLFYRIGEQLGNANLGIGLCTLFQLLVLAISMAGLIAVLAKCKVKCWKLVLLTIYGALLPVNAYMSITTTKDTLFSVFVLWFLAGVYVYLNQGRKFPKTFRLLYILAVMGVVLFRNNGKYALAVTWIVLVLVVVCKIIAKKSLSKWRILLVDTSIGLLAGVVLAAGLAKGLNAQPGDKREMLSMPIQQLARTMVYHGGLGVVEQDDDTIEKRDKDLINELFLYESVKNYRPEISDPVKRWTNTYVVRYKTAEFVKTYLNLLVKYPADFVNAALAVNAGWLSLTDDSHATINQFEFKEGLGYIQTNWSQELEGTYLCRDSKWSWLLDKMNAFATNNTYLKIPVVRFLVAPGIYLWSYLFMAAWLFLHRKYSDLIPFTWLLGYYGTLILGPAVQMRYLYPLMIAFPFFLLYAGKTTAYGSKAEGSVGDE